MNNIGRHRMIKSVTAHRQHTIPVTDRLAFHPVPGMIRHFLDAVLQLIEKFVGPDSASFPARLSQMPIRSLSADSRAVIRLWPEYTNRMQNRKRCAHCSAITGFFGTPI